MGLGQSGRFLKSNFTHFLRLRMGLHPVAKADRPVLSSTTPCAPNKPDRRGREQCEYPGQSNAVVPWGVKLQLPGKLTGSCSLCIKLSV